VGSRIMKRHPETYSDKTIIGSLSRKTDLYHRKHNH
jgi:hypothetical protein